MYTRLFTAKMFVTAKDLKEANAHQKRTDLYSPTRGYYMAVFKKEKKSLKGVLKTNISDYLLIGGRQRGDFKCHGVFNPSLSLDI